MKIYVINLILSLFLCSIAFNVSYAKDKETLVYVLGTGGTISAKGISDTDYKEGKTGIDEILESTFESPVLKKMKSLQLMNIGSQSIDDDHLFLMANKINDLQKDDQVEGILLV